MNDVTWVPNNALRPALYRTNYVLKPDLKLLRLSLTEHGWMSPVVVRTADATIIDGFHRWVAAQDAKVTKAIGSDVPVLYRDMDEVDAMILHVRLNRARGAIVAKPFSSLIQQIVVSGKYAPEDLEDVLCMSADEMDLMLDGSLIKKRKVAEHVYSRAWVPVEAPADATSTPAIERPPTPDR